MGRPQFPPPAQVTVAEPFWAGLAAHELRLPVCSVCGRWHWYPDAAGADCEGGELVWRQVAHTGTLHTFTKVVRPFLPGEATTPYTVGLVELDGVDGPRLPVTIVDGVDWVVDQRVQARFETMADGTATVAFEPLPEADDGPS